MLDMPFILQSPLAMLGLLALLIPLCIHLLSKARPRVVAFAHIAFIKVTTSPVLRQLRLTQLILLGLRMLMLLLATLILAQVFWYSTDQQFKSHILVSEDWLQHATDTEKQKLIDQVNDSDLVLLGTQNRSINSTELAQWSTDKQLNSALNIWSKVADYAEQLSGNETINVYTTNRLQQFIGGRVPLSEWVEWHVKNVEVESMTHAYTVTVKVIYDSGSESLLVYLRGAFEVINTHKNVDLKVDYVSNEKSKDESKPTLTYDRIIDLSEQGLAQPQHQHITQAELANIKQADFVFTLARMLFSSQSQAWWRQNTLLSTAQITQYSATDNQEKALPAYQTSPNKKPNSKTSHSTALHIWLVLILVAIFILERVLSEWPKRRFNPGVDK